MEIVRQYLSYILEGRKIEMCDPDRMIARGLGVVVGIKERDDEIKDMLLTDICPFSLGVGVRNHDGSDRDMMSILIERNTISMVFWKYSYIRRRPVRDRRWSSKRRMVP